MPIPFTKKQLDASVPQIPLDDPRLNAPVYLEVATREQRIRGDYRYSRSPWTIRDCVPSTWINKHCHTFHKITFVGVNHFGDIGLGESGTEKASLMYWSDSTGIWRSSHYWYVRNPPEQEDAPDPSLFYVVEHWLRFDTMDDEEKIIVLKKHIEHHNREIQKYQRSLDLPNFPFFKERERQKRVREREKLEQVKRLLLGLGVTLDLGIINAGKTGQLSLF